MLIALNVLTNFVLVKLGGDKMSFSKKVKNNVKKAVAYINDFEANAADVAIDREYDYVVCGHIHNPQIREISNKKGFVLYLNSGDWIEHLSALEYNQQKWEIFEFEKAFPPKPREEKKREKKVEPRVQYIPSSEVVLVIKFSLSNY